MEKYFLSKKYWLVVGVFIWTSLFFFQKTNLAASDLGRHIKNGEVILSTGRVFHTNLYSYTNPDFPVPNHHWLFGVISYLVHQVAGFEGLTIMSATLYTLSILIAFYFAVQKSASMPALLAVVLALPLLADRSETRPEAFSLLFFSALFWGVGQLVENKRGLRLQILVGGALVLMALWVNIHIFFILAGVIVGAALIHAVANKQTVIAKNIALLAGALAIGAFINPLGIQLVLYPLQIFGNYGYRVSENQNLWFFLQHFTRPSHWYLVFFMVVVLAAGIYYAKTHLKKSLYHFIIVGVFCIFTFRMTRIENVFAIASVPFLASTFNLLWQEQQPRIRKFFGDQWSLMFASMFGFGLVAALLATGLFIPFNGAMGLGLTPGYDNSLRAVRELAPQIKGNIFNNFDSGSFLIFALYPDYQLYIDNRAEAFPAEFIQTSYVKAQEDEAIWQQVESKYDIGSIIFYRHEATNWGQEFLVKRFEDKTWVPVYVDNYLIIFLKDRPEHQELLEKYRLPDTMFSVTKS